MMPNDKLGNAFWIASLLEKHVRKEQLTPGEQEAIEKWLAVSEGNRALFERITDESQLALALVELQGADTESALVKAHARIGGNVRLRVLRWRWAAAAAVLLFTAIGVGIYRYVGNNQAPTVQIDFQEDVLPGGNRATLTLAGGQTIDLSEAQAGIIVGDEISYLDGTDVLDGRLKTGDGRSKAEDLGLLTLATPKGGTYQITLPDGTKVWLNAASSLRYPGSFDGDERVVELEGEAYFEVSEQAHGGRSAAGSGSHVHTFTSSQKIPFKIISKGQTVEVLGTQFNISAYADDLEVKTTLVEGSVQIVNANSKVVNKLLPGQQSTVRGRNTDIQAVDTEKYTAWKTGLFHFGNTPFEDMMRQISRWYDVEVVYTATIPGDTFTGKMSRDLSLMTVLELLNVSNVQVRLEGKQLIVE